MSGLSSSYTSTSGTFVNVSSLRTYNSNPVLFKAASAEHSDKCDGPEGWIQLSMDSNNEASKRQYTVLLSVRNSQHHCCYFSMIVVAVELPDGGFWIKY